MMLTVPLSLPFVLFAKKFDEVPWPSTQQVNFSAYLHTISLTLKVKQVSL